jgi:hypothetical protein
MTYDPRKLPHVVADYYGNLPHPDVPEVKVKEYEAFAKVAARFFENPKPEREQISQAFHLLNNAGLSPAQFERVWDIAKPLANRLLGTPPTIHDLDMLRDAHPGDIQKYYLDHPHPKYPEVSAGDFNRYYHAATPIAQQQIGRFPVEHEVARFAAAGYDTQDMANHYTDTTKGSK